MDIKRIKNENIIKMYNWAKVFNYIDVEPCSYSFDNDTKTYRCDFYMAKYDKVIIGFGDNYYEACSDASNQVSELIDKYLEEHPDIEIKQFFSIEENDVVLNYEDKPVVVKNERGAEKQFRSVVNREMLVDQFVKAYKELEDDDYGYFFQVISECLLPQYNSQKEQSDAIIDSIIKRFGENAAHVKVRLEEGLYIISAKILYKDEYVKNKGDLQ